MTADAWTVMVCHLSGDPPPAPPPIPGTVHRAPPAPDVDAVAEQHDAQELKLPAGWWGRP